MDTEARPLIVTLELDEKNQARFEEERRRYYPQKLNRIPAHVSLFHALPGEEQPAVEAALARAAGLCGPFSVEVHDLMRLGRGTAYKLRAPELGAVHGELRAAFLPWLTRQDLQAFRPHVVVQNKAEPEAARILFERLTGQFRPWSAEAVRLLLWRYDGGPWTPLRAFAFEKAK